MHNLSERKIISKVTRDTDGWFLTLGQRTARSPTRTLMTQSSYKGRVITLMSGRQDDGAWVCEYTIVEFRPLRSFNESGFPIGSFITLDAAEAAAVDIAQGVIDARDPVGVLSTDRFWRNDAKADTRSARTFA